MRELEARVRIKLTMEGFANLGDPRSGSVSVMGIYRQLECLEHYDGSRCRVYCGFLTCEESCCSYC